ncbi:UDP-N-acetylmuramoylalanine--D-glutamate ligase-like [Ylistrum balloti]|uniref:UDP-N-acetylmuramoylalanine--D-glutamate ligase-like n=1 Tax=Ylistrum balloti TaxID=509963 RepID=UPI002905EEFC|nr:UDP-N-acetylmuramoylalanine--D-glutamate ligase-like [Ylistrum balloti]
MEGFRSYPLECEFGTHSKECIHAADYIIKNPAIPKHAPIITYAKTEKKCILSDISLYLDWNADTHAPSAVITITGTKGKSSISHAIHSLLSRGKNIEADSHFTVRSYLAGNIRRSVLTLIEQNIRPKYLVCELSAQQIGDLRIVNDLSINTIECQIFTNFMRDHLNYYSNMKEYFLDKSYLFRKSAGYRNIIIPNDKWGRRLALHYKAEQCYWHSATPLDSSQLGSWFEDGVLLYRSRIGATATALRCFSNVPYSYYIQNVLILMAFCLAHNEDMPRDRETWEKLLTLEHRKERVANNLKRVFINDSAATIPQAMNIAALAPHSVHLICGGTDKELLPQDLLVQCKKAEHCYLLEGTFTSLLLPLLRKERISYSGPYNSLQHAVEEAYTQSYDGDIIILSPGCASFGMFKHEFDRGEQFKNIVQSLG